MRIIILVIVFVFGSQFGNGQTWETYLDKEGNYSISFPFDFEKKVDSTAFPLRTVLLCKPISDDNLFYSISYYDDFNNMYNSDSLKNIEFDLEYTQRKNRLKLTAKYPKVVSGYPGREFRYKDVLGDKLVRIQVYIVKNRVFELRVETKEELNFNKSINYFFNSFKLIGVTENKPAYLNLPSAADIEKRPFYADFQGETEQRISVMETVFGKSGVVMEMNQNFDPNKDGILSLGVMYTIIPKQTKLTKEEFDKIVSDQESLVGQVYSEGKIIGKERINISGYDGYKLTLSYKIMGEPVKDIRLLLVDDKNRYFNIMAICISETTMVQNFIKSFNVKK